MKTSMKIRRYQKSDHDQVWTLHGLALETAGVHAGHGPWDEDLHRIEDVYLEIGGEILVGTLESRIVAMGALKRLSSDRGEIKRMRVHPDHQRRGYGQVILQTLEARAAELGYTTLQLDTTIQQIPAQKLYIQNGYAETGRGQTGRFEFILYEKALLASGAARELVR